ncbi:MAG TPA: DUF3108 domain-containing protein [Flavobacteriales bacterium]|nr:DUF3108 domain-containing protein [Flavobacteriales bacterium]
MARTSTFLLAGTGLLTMAFAQSNHPAEPNSAPAPSSTTNYRTINHNAFKAGEKLTYVVHYGWMNAGEAVVELREAEQPIMGRKVLRAVGRGRSLGAFNTFYKVDDYYESQFDAEGVFPWMFQRRVSEGGYEFSQDYFYRQHKNEVVTQKQQTHAVPSSVQDMLSAFYYARTIDFSNARPGDVYTIQTFLDDELWPLQMKYVGKETIKLRNGKYRCMKFQPVVQEGRVFKTNDDLNVWITDDGNKIPVLAQAKVLVGSIKMELSQYEGLSHPIAKQ